MARYASFAINFQEVVCRLPTAICWLMRSIILYILYCPYDGSKNDFTILVFRAVGNSNFSTTDYCTVELAPTEGLLRSLIQGTVNVFFTTPALQFCLVEATELKQACSQQR